MYIVFQMRRNRFFLITLFLFFWVDFIAEILFERFHFQSWFPLVYFLFICCNFLIGYSYWKKQSARWLRLIWIFIYLFVVSYYLISWAMDSIGLGNHRFIYKIYTHIALSPMTFCFVYVINYLANIKLEENK